MVAKLVLSPSPAPVLTPALAQEIAGETSAIIGFNILITDTEGLVIGSGDVARVGSFHEASVEVMQTLEPAAHNASQARQLIGVRPGVTLPIVLDNQAVGTVGITGSPARVRRFGLVVKRQTEILLQESLLVRSRLLRERALEDLLRDIAYFDAEVIEPDFIAFRATELGYDLALPRVAVLVDVGEGIGPQPLRGPSGARWPAAGAGGASGPAAGVAGGASGPAGGVAGASGPAGGVATLQSAMLRSVRDHLADPQSIVAPMGAGRLVALHRVPSAGLRAGTDRTLRAICRRVVADIAQRHGIRARVGIGDGTTSVAGLRDSYEDAAAALQLGPRLDETSRVYAIDDLRLYQLLVAVGHRTRARFVDVLADALRDQRDWPLLQETVLAWCESGFSLVGAAAALHIHRNTLIYRLDKIARLSGRGSHDHRATLGLYLACLADKLGS